jgi:hypothetical protein
MKNIKLLLVALQLGVGLTAFTQQEVITPDLSKVRQSDRWTLYNRKVKINGEVNLNGMEGDGLLWLREPVFRNGKIEADIRGEDKPGGSFVGLAFHGLNDSTYDVVYFRPFNFRNPDRNAHSVQYISHPSYTWYLLREENPGEYENTVTPVPDPNDWFHVTITVNYPVVKVYVNHSEEPSLEIEQLSQRKEGWVGFWVGNTSGGSFRNLKITLEPGQ